MDRNSIDDLDIFNSLFEAENIVNSQASYIKPVPDKQTLEKYRNAKASSDVEEYINSGYKINYDIKVSEAEISSLINQIAEKFDSNKYSGLIDECKTTVIQSIVGPFGLSKVFINDKEGGNVTTIHNFKKGVTATDEDKQRYDSYSAKYGENATDKFDRTAYEGKKFIDKRKSEIKKPEALKDAYTGKEIPKDGRSHLDHVVSAHEIDQDVKNNLFMNKEERVDMALKDSNLKMTNSSLNQSKGDKNLEEWMNSKDKNGQTKAEKYEINQEEAKRINEQARKDIKNQQIKSQVKKQGKEIISTGASQAAKQGFQQAMGFVLSEFAEAVFFEIDDIIKKGFKNGKLDESFITILRIRLNRIKEKVLSKCHYAITIFKEGAISGFLSNIITVIINSFLTTSKRLTRIIREGFGSIYRAFKTIINPPAGMSMSEALHEASKIFASGLVVAGGILAEEAISKALTGVPFSGIITSIIVGILTGLTTIVVVYMIDKLDLLRVNENKKLEFINNELDNMIDANMNQIESLVF